MEGGYVMGLDLDVIDHYENWKKTLGAAVKTGKTLGMEDHTIANVATSVGDFLSNNVDPASRENRVLKELWDQGTDGEKHIMANLIVKLVD